MAFPVSIESVRAAEARIAPYIRKTPLLPFDPLTGRDGRQTWMKCELFQTTGSFKLRGATNCILQNLDQAKQKGVVAASAGNHAQGVAAICNKLGIRATIVMPKATQPIKVKNTQDWGARVELVGSVYDESFEHALTISQKEGSLLVHPFRDPHVMAGQGTVALELAAEKEFAQMDAVVIAIGGGGLITGCASVLKTLKPGIKVYGVTAKNAPSLYKSFKAKKIVEGEVQHTLADTIATKKADTKMLEGVLNCVDDVFSISEEMIAHAIALLAEKSKLVVEGAGAIGVAALLENLVPEKNVGVILCGGNIDLVSFSHVLERGLVEQGRLVRLSVTAIDRPGGLHQLTEILAKAEANILQVFHQRTTLDAAVGETKIELQLETKGTEHTQEILHALTARGLRVERLQ
jgi:threonine dehydratase